MTRSSAADKQQRRSNPTGTNRVARSWTALGNQTTQHAIAAAGFCGPGQAYPHQDTIARAFGRHHRHGVSAYLDGAAADACRALGAAAYTTQDKVVFRRPPSLRTAAHEAAHIVQQQHGLQLPGGIGHAGDRHEADARAVAARVAAGQSAEPLLDRMVDHASGMTARPQLQLEDEEEEEKPSPEIDFETAGLPQEVFKDLFILDRALRFDPSLRLKGTEMSSLYTLSLAGAHAGAYGGSYEDYVKGLGGLSPSGTTDIAGNVIDLLSLTGGVRIGDYFGSDLFLKHRLKPYALSTWGLFRMLGWLGLAQGVYSGGLAAADAIKGDEPDPNQDPNEFVSPNAMRHLAMLKFLATEAPFKAPFFKPPEVFGGLSPLSAPSYKASAFSHFTDPKIPEQGWDYKTSVEGGGHDFTLVHPFNLAGVLGGKGVGVSDTRDLSKYRGPQLSTWMALQNKRPTDAQISAGSLPYWYGEGGILGGYGGHTGLFEGGARVGEGTQSMFLRGGYSYTAPEGSRLSSLGLTGTYFKWAPTDQAAKGFEGGPTGGEAFRLTPFMSFGNLLGSEDKKLSIDAAASLAFGGGEDVSLAMARLGIGYKHLARDKEGKVDPARMPKWSLGAAYSASRPQWWNPEMPLMHGGQLKGNVGNLFFGSQFHVGERKLTDPQATALGIKPEDRREFELLINLGYNFDFFHSRHRK